MDEEINLKESMYNSNNILFQKYRIKFGVQPSKRYNIYCQRKLLKKELLMRKVSLSQAIKLYVNTRENNIFCIMSEITLNGKKMIRKVEEKWEPQFL